MSELRHKLISLISKQLNIPEEQVTTEFLHEYRVAKVYPNMKVDFETRVGGHNSHFRHYLTQNQVNSQREKSEAFLDQFKAAEGK